MQKLVNVSAKAAIVNHDKVLILQCSSTIEPKVEFWDLPGGRVDDDESIGQALTRELKEEILNLGEYKIGKLLYAWRHPNNFADGHGLVIICYKIKADLTTVDLSEEHSSYRWIGLNEIDKLKADGPVLSPNAEEVLRLALKP